MASRLTPTGIGTRPMKWRSIANTDVRISLISPGRLSSKSLRGLSSETDRAQRTAAISGNSSVLKYVRRGDGSCARLNASRNVRFVYLRRCWLTTSCLPQRLGNAGTVTRSSPPGLSNRAASRRPAASSSRCSRTSKARTTSNDLESSGASSNFPITYSTPGSRQRA